MHTPVAFDALGILDEFPAGDQEKYALFRERPDTQRLDLQHRAFTKHDLRHAGIHVIEITGDELVRGRGGPRCMSRPVHRMLATAQKLRGASDGRCSGSWKTQRLTEDAAADGRRGD